MEVIYSSLANYGVLRTYQLIFTDFTTYPFGKELIVSKAIFTTKLQQESIRNNPFFKEMETLKKSDRKYSDCI